MPELVDARGQPMRPRKAELTREIAAPTLTGVRQVVSGHPAEGLDPQGLAAILRDADAGDALRYLELAEQIEEKELQFATVLGTRKRQVAQLEITVEPSGDSARAARDADLVRAFLDRDTLQAEVVDILDAIGKGFSVCELVWETSARQWMPRAIEWRDPRWFRFDPTDGRTLRLVEGDGRERDLPPAKFIRHTVQAKSGLPIRGGLARPVSWWWLFKNLTVKDWVAFAEIYGQPLRVGKYHNGATDQEIRTLLRALSNIGTDAAGAIPETMQIEFLKDSSASASADIYEKLCRYTDELISKLVLGQTTTTDAISGGHAVSKEHNEVRGDIEGADAMALAATLNRDLVRPLVALNHGAPPDGRYPKIRIARPDALDVEQVQKLVQLGLRVSASDVRQRVGLKEPEGDDDVLTGRAPGAAPAGVAPSENAPGAAQRRETPSQDGPPAADAEATETAAQAAATRPEQPGDVADALAAQLDRRAMTAQSGALDALRGLVDNADSLEAIAEGLLDRFPDLDPGELADRLRESMVLAELAGRDAVTSDAAADGDTEV